jgi:hypothetical protein
MREAVHLLRPADRDHPSEQRNHVHLSFERWSKHDGHGQRFSADVDQIFARNGLAFKIDEDGLISRPGPPEGRQILSEFAPRTVDPSLDDNLRDAVTRFASRHPRDQLDGPEKLWDDFERLKTLELGGQKQDSIRRLTTGRHPLL